MSKEQRVGPKVRVDVRYECNGCQFHKVDESPDSDLKYHACHHPAIIEEYSCPQFIGGGKEELNVYFTADTPAWMCPYIRSED